jgi:hypothetical protein
MYIILFNDNFIYLENKRCYLYFNIKLKDIYTNKKCLLPSEYYFFIQNKKYYNYKFYYYLTLYIIKNKKIPVSYRDIPKTSKFKIRLLIELVINTIYNKRFLLWTV